MEMENKLKELKQRLLESSDINSAVSVLSWDQTTYMPPGGAAARGRQMALLSQMGMEKFIDPAVGKLLDELRPYEESLPYDSDDAALIRVTRRNYERLVRIPPEFMGRFMAHSAESYQVWAEARPQNDFAKVQPYLEKTLDFSRQIADYFPGYEHIADPLIDNSDYGMKASSVAAVFAELRQALVPLVQAVTAQPPADDACLRLPFPEAAQLDFSKVVAEKIGYNFKRGRLDKTHHPFTTRFAADDVRITTRVNEHHFNENLFAVIHEAGHALYELGVNPAFDGTPLGGGTSAGVHESQSRLWENVVGRSLPFWEYFYSQLQAVHPAMNDVPLDTFYRAINKVERSLIRVEADELTYNLHIMLRFDLELALLEGKLAVKDLPEAWRARFQADFGIQPPDDKDGAMQDVHWYAGTIGGVFQGYTLGNILGAQFFAAARKSLGDVESQMRRGEFAPLHNWLIENIYTHGAKFTADELIQRVTGGKLDIAPYIAYLKTKYGALYNI
jgi:carboxypeptidase Taq